MVRSSDQCSIRLIKSSVAIFIGKPIPRPDRFLSRDTWRARFGGSFKAPEIFNTDQGSQFTCIAFTGLLLKNEIKISMDGKGAWRDNIFVERLWRTIKYEEVYLRAYASVPEARASIGRYIDGFYNARRPHSRLHRRTPDEAYFTALQPIAVAA
jgi:putative transposase